MQYNLAFRYFIDRTGSFVNILLVIVCNFIPIIGLIVVQGYRAETLERLVNDPELKKHRKFNFDHFMEYLTRGLWPFLVRLVLSLASLFILGIPVGAVFAISIAAELPAINLLIPLIAFAWMILFTCLLWPSTMHAELTARFDLRGCWRFTKEFWKLLGFNAFLSIFILGVISWFVMLCGLLLCVIGIYPAQVICTMAATHLQAQHYLLYLDAGGRPLEQEAEDDEFEDEEDEFEGEDPYEHERGR